MEHEVRVLQGQAWCGPSSKEVTSGTHPTWKRVGTEYGKISSSMKKVWHWDMSAHDHVLMHRRE
jgi:hypothetical protein